MVNIIKHKGRGCAIFKRDLKCAYRQISVCSGDYNLLAYHWKQNIYDDHALPMGLRSAALICQWFTKAVHFIDSKRGWYTVNYLDDFEGWAWQKSGKRLTKHLKS